MSKTDLTTGQVVDTSTTLPKQAGRPARKAELYKGEPPQSNDGKMPQVFTIQQKCGLADVDRQGKKFNCAQKLQVVRVKNQVFEKDESGFGGQLNYDDKDIRQYITCPIHGGLPTGYQSWEPGQNSKL